MKVRVLSDLQAIRPVEQAWQDLADRAGGRATSQPWWCLAWWRHLGAGVPLVVTVWRADTLVALAPLHERRICGVRVVRFLGHGLGAVSEILGSAAEPGAAEVAWSALLGDAPRLLDLLEYRLPAGGIEALRRVSPRTEVRPSDACPVATVEGTLDRFLARRPKGLRRTLRRADERLAADARRHDVEVVAGPERLAEVLGEVAAVYEAAERDRPRQNLLAPPWESFTRQVLAGSARLGRLRLFVGRVDGHPVSFDVGFVTADRIELWIGRYDPGYGPIAPGHLAMRAVVDHALSTSIRQVDLGLGDDRYKRLWCDGGYPTVNVTAASSRPVLIAGRGVLAARRWVRRQATRVTRPPATGDET